jgi:hypothetical protein
MRLSVVCVLSLAAALPTTAPSAQAASRLPAAARTSDMVVAIGARRRRPRDCTPYNGPYGFYGNIWCQPPNQASYLRNLGASWPMKTPPALETTKPHITGSDW